MARNGSIEIQIHPASPRRRVRYYFLDRRQQRLAGLTLGLLVLVVLCGWALLPWSIAGWRRARAYDLLLSERTLQGERAQVLAGELEKLREVLHLQHTRIERVLLTYGLSVDDMNGSGGYPFAPAAPIDSIWSETVQRGRQLQSEVQEQLAVLDLFIEEIETFEQMHVDQIRTTPSISPLAADQFVLTSPFGTRQSPFTKKSDLHPGLDMAAKPGTPILAPADGVVVFAGRFPSRQSMAWWRYGNLVAIRHSERFITLYGHCDEILVQNGQMVSQRDLIATVGDSGWSTSPHLHYEVRALEDEGQFVPVDPRIYMLDHQWRDEELFLVQGRRAPDLSSYEPLPRLIAR